MTDQDKLVFAVQFFTMGVGVALFVVGLILAWHYR